MHNCGDGELQANEINHSFTLKLNRAGKRTKTKWEMEGGGSGGGPSNKITKLDVPLQKQKSSTDIQEHVSQSNSKNLKKR